MTTLAAAIVDRLEAMGVERVFGYPGGRVIEVFEALADAPIEVVRPRDERQAAVMAECHGRLTGRPGVLMGQGPWVASLGAMGLMEATLGSTPLVAITEASERGEFAPLAPYQQARGDYGGVDVPTMLGAVTKETWTPRRPTETLIALELAFKHAQSGRPGPTAVVLDGAAVREPVPEDTRPPTFAAGDRASTGTPRPSRGAVDRAAAVLRDAERPVVVAGNGVHAARAYDELADVAEAIAAPVVTSYLGKSAIPETHPLAGGVIGSYGHDAANHIVSEADALLVVGSRLNPMDVNWLADGFVRPDEQTICQVDVEARNAGWVYPADVHLVGDAALALTDLRERLPDGELEGSRGVDVAGAARAEAFDREARDSDASPIRPERAIAELDAAVDSEAVVLADSGNNRFWLLHHLQTARSGTFRGSGGVAGMGWAAPAAVAAELAGHDAVAVAGDGGFAMTATAVETAREYGVAPTWIVLDDDALGMVREIDPAIPGVEFPGTDLAAVAAALGADSRRVTDPGDLADAYEAALGSDAPAVVVVTIDPAVNAGDALQSSFYREAGGLHE
ncbi:MAG: thiamine pyrophosphate-binding protein [Halobacteriales archaeon]